MNGAHGEDAYAHLVDSETLSPYATWEYSWIRPPTGPGALPGRSLPHGIDATIRWATPIAAPDCSR
jgi:hypothetical protein